MAEVRAVSGVAVQQVPEGWRFHYQRASLTRAQGTIAFIVLALILPGIVCFPFGLLFTFVMTPIVAPILAYKEMKRRAAPTTFLLTPTHLVIGDKEYDRKQVRRIYVKVPGSDDPQLTYTSGDSGFFIVGSRMEVAAAVIGAATSQASLQTAQLSADFIRAGFFRIAYRVRFTYGEQDFDLATGLPAERAQQLVAAILEKAQA